MLGENSGQQERTFFQREKFLFWSCINSACRTQYFYFPLCMCDILIIFHMSKLYA